VICIILVITHGVGVLSKFIFKLEYMGWIGEFSGLVDLIAKDSTSGRLLDMFHPL